MKQVVLFLICVLVLITNVTAQKVSRPAFSVKHSANGNTFVLHNDTQGNAVLHHAGESNSLQPALINFNPALYFNGDSTYAFLVFDSLVHWEELTLMTAYLTAEADALLGLWELKQDTLSLMSLNSRYICFDKKKLRYTDTNFRCPVVNVSSHHFPVDSVENSKTFFLAKSGSLFFTGSIGEVLLFNTPLSAFEKACWQTSLSLKYSSTMRKSNYISSTGDTLWNFLHDSVFSVGIAGLGFDTLTGLNQKQSTIYADAVTLSNGNEFIDNEINPNALQQGNYLLWGHNGKELDFERYQSENDSNRLYLLPRFWRIRKHFPNANTNIAVQLSYEYPFYVEPQYLRLAVSPASSDSIQPFTSVLYSPDSITGEKVYFKNLPFDTSLVTEFTLAYTGEIQPQSNAKNSYKGTIGSQTDTPNDKINLYPNPTKGNYQLDIQLEEESPVVITILDAQGKKRSETRHTGNRQYNIHGNLKTSGYYTVTVKYNKGIKTHGLIVK